MSEEHEIEESFEQMEFTRKKAVHAVVSFALSALVIALLIAVVLILKMLAPKPEEVAPEKLIRAVKVRTVRQEDRPLQIVTQGVVESMRDVMISSEVGGRVVWVSPNLLKGAAVSEGEELVKIEKADYISALRRAEASREEAKLQLSQENARRDQALRDWKKLGRGEPGELVLREPHIAAAEALLASAAEEVERAGRDIDRTIITAPFGGVVRDESVEFGAVLNPGSVVASVYSTEEQEIRLPLSLEDFGALARGDDGTVIGEVKLTGVIGLEEYHWPGRVVRTDGEIDRKTLSATVIVRIGESEENPGFLRRPPIGMFVEGTMPGKVLENVIEIPRRALRGADKVLVVDEESRMREAEVTILKTLRETVLVSDGLQPGDEVIVTRMSGAVEGDEVKVVDRENGEPEEVTAP